MELPGKSPRSRHIDTAQAAGELQSPPHRLSNQRATSSPGWQARILSLGSFTSRMIAGCPWSPFAAGSVASGVVQTRKWRPHGPGSLSGRSLNAETIGKATQKPCPEFDMRFPALISRRYYALVSWRQTGRRPTSPLKTCILQPRQTGPYRTVKRKAISAEVRSQSLNLAALKAAIFFLAFITVDPGLRASFLSRSDSSLSSVSTSLGTCRCSCSTLSAFVLEFIAEFCSN